MKKIKVLVSCLVLSSFVLAGCSDAGEPFEEKSYTPDAPIAGISLDVRDREIEVALSEDEQVHIRYSENSKESYEISVSDERVLTMECVSDKKWTDYIGGKKPVENDRKILLQIPDGCLETLTLATTNENIALSDISVAGSVSISANGGNIAFEGLDVGDGATLSVKNGDILGTIAGSADEFAIHSEIKKGENNLPDQKDGGEKTLNLFGNNGEIRIEFLNR